VAEQLVDPIDVRLEVSVSDQRRGHPNGVAEEEALVENLAAAERTARNVPR